MISFKPVALAAALLVAAPALATAAATPNPALYSAMRWRELGPFRAGWATFVTGVPDKPDTFYFGGAGGGVWKSDNAGRSWKPLTDRLPAAAIGALAVAPSNDDVIYAGTGQVTPRYDIGAGLGVYRSADGGKHWQSAGLKDTRYIGAIWVNPKDPNDVLVGAQGHFFGPSDARGVYRSTDGGKHWSHVLKINDWTGVVGLASDPADPKVLIASAWEAHQYPWLSYFAPVSGAGSALYKSVDGGKSWTRLSGGGWPEGPLGRIGIAVTHTKSGTRIYAAINSKDHGGLWRSDDGGAHWARVNKEDAFTDWYASRLTVAPNDPDIVYTVGQSIRRCSDGGAHCTIIKGAPGGDDYHHIWINPLHPDHIITGADQGAVVSVDGWKSWSSWYNQPTAQVYHVAADNRFPYWIYAGQQDSGSIGIASRSDYGSLTFRDWHPVGADERGYDIPDQTDPDIVYGSGLGGTVSKWNAKTGQVAEITPYPDGNYGKRQTTTRYRYQWTTPLEGSRTGKPALYLGAQVVFRTEDRGEHWQVISPDLTGKAEGAKHCDGNPTPEDAKLCGYGVISAIEPSPRHADEIWVGTDDGLIQLTRDGGKHWTNVTPPQIPLWGKVREISVSALEDGTAYAAIDTHRIDRFHPLVLKTHDYGKSWEEIGNGLPSDQFASVVRADPKKAGLLYAGTDAGAYVSFDDGAHWQSLQQNLPTAWITDLLVHDGDLIAGTEGRGIWVLDDVAPLRQIAPGIASEGAHLFTPRAAFRVHPDNNKDTPLPPTEPVGQNPPAGAIIDYWLGATVKGPVTLDITDASGHLVRRFASNVAPTRPDAERYFAKGWLRPLVALSGKPGMHRFTWNLRYARPRAISYSYSIAAVWGENTPILPGGPYVLPGTYTLTLTAGGRSQSVPLVVKEDPRIHVTETALQSSLATSEEIAKLLAPATGHYAQQQAVTKQLDKRFPADAKQTDAKLAAALAALRKKPAPGTPSFTHAEGRLTSVEKALEIGGRGADGRAARHHRPRQSRTRGGGEGVGRRAGGPARGPQRRARRQRRKAAHHSAA